MSQPLLTNNLGYKLLAVALAFLLWTYVQNAENPPVSKTLEITPILRDVPGHLKVNWKTRPKVSVTLRDRKDVIARLVESQLVARISVKGAVEGEHTYPLEVGFTERSLSDAPRIEKQEPREFTFNFETIHTVARRIDVFAEAPLGSRWVETVVDPTTVMLRGPRSLVKSARVVARVDKRNATLPAGEEYVEKIRLTFEDASGQTLETSDLVCEPPATEFRARLEVEFKQFPVHVTVTGAPQSGYRVYGGIIAEPGMVMVAGSDDALRVLDSIPTEPIDLTGATKTIERVARLKLPLGVRARGSSRIRVIIPIRDNSPAGHVPGPAPGD